MGRHSLEDRLDCLPPWEVYGGGVVFASGLDPILGFNRWEDGMPVESFPMWGPFTGHRDWSFGFGLGSGNERWLDIEGNLWGPRGVFVARPKELPSVELSHGDLWRPNDL